MRAFSEDSALITGINVTPLVDIVLVLLIIFMAAAPLIHRRALDLTLPKAASAEPRPSAAATLQMNARGGLSLEGRALDIESLPGSLRALLKTEPELRLSLAADRSIPYGEVVAVLDAARSAGVRKISLDTRVK